MKKLKKFTFVLFVILACMLAGCGSSAMFPPAPVYTPFVAPTAVPRFIDFSNEREPLMWSPPAPTDNEPVYDGQSVPGGFKALGYGADEIIELADRDKLIVNISSPGNDIVVYYNPDLLAAAVQSLNCPSWAVHVQYMDQVIAFGESDQTWADPIFVTDRSSLELTAGIIAACELDPTRTQNGEFGGQPIYERHVDQAYDLGMQKAKELQAAGQLPFWLAQGEPAKLAESRPVAYDVMDLGVPASYQKITFGEQIVVGPTTLINESQSAVYINTSAFSELIEGATCVNTVYFKDLTDDDGAIGRGSASYVSVNARIGGRSVTNLITLACDWANNGYDWGDRTKTVTDRFFALQGLPPILILAPGYEAPTFECGSGCSEMFLPLINK